MQMITIQDVLKNMRVPLTPEREELINRAYTFAEKAHTGQKRKSGEDYIQHSLHTALNIAHIGMGSKTIAAGLLHDVPEDTHVTLKDVEKIFGHEISFLVDGVTKVGKIRLRGEKEELYLENLRKMFLAMASDIRVVIIKLADRLHNMETLDALPVQKRQRIALETMEVFAPLANRLGIGDIKGRMEDLAFKYLDPENYEYIKNLSEKEVSSRKKNLDKSILELKKELLREKINVVDIYGRTKHLYRLFQKMQRHDMDINKIYDLTGVRIIVPEVADCYETLGIVHHRYHPLVGRIKDYISLPKPNGYQSIHTTVFGPDGKIMEIQIRTQKMHDEAEFGIAAHWIYTEKGINWLNLLSLGKKQKKFSGEELNWVKQLQEWQLDMGKSDTEFMEGLKIEFFKNHIFAFTPIGDVIDLPEEATTIDFAYKVHSEIGDRAVGAKANGKMVALDYKIKNGDVIEIIISKEHKSPSRDWLRFVHTTLAKSHIKRALKKDGLL
jgi:GTP diphosphokinase / guanosine-3',5'-bis(diphosphate) 3'-diphosphatase